MTVAIGLEICLDSPPPLLREARRFALLSNQAAVDQQFRHSAELLARKHEGRLKALFGPQHGLWSTQQDNMIETGHSVHPKLGIPIHSLYSETRKPTQQMLAGIDLLVVDLQDVGTRVYTYIWTLSYCLSACAQAGIPVLVLDRPNPLGGELVEGPLLDLDYRSFVGRAPMPMRHGLSIGELARFVNDQIGYGADLHVLPMQGWRRNMLWPATGRTWVPPSPNLPTFDSALVYPGQVLLEGTNLSEGRGTTTPFQQFGAPFLDPWQLVTYLEPRSLQGVLLRPVQFVPTFQKWQNQTCQGLFLHVTDPAAFRPYRTTLALLRAVHELWPRQFHWQSPPYEYETEKTPIDILSGGNQLRAWIDRDGPWHELEALAAEPADWWSRVRRHLLY